jgi:hypothetical protein
MLKIVPISSLPTHTPLGGLQHSYPYSRVGGEYGTSMSKIVPISSLPTHTPLGGLRHSYPYSRIGGEYGTSSLSLQIIVNHFPETSKNKEAIICGKSKRYSMSPQI